MKIYNTKILGKWNKIINILFHKVYKNKKIILPLFLDKNVNNIKKDVKKSFVCIICYDRFSTKKTLNRHLLICNSLTKELYPPEKTFISFDEKKAAKFASPLSVIGFSDFEAKLESISGSKNKSENNLGSNKSCTITKDIYSIVSFSVVLGDNLGKLIFEKCYCGQNAGEYFLDTLDKIEEQLLLTICKNNNPISIDTLSPWRITAFPHCDQMWNMSH